jgi:hypothetical protein
VTIESSSQLHRRWASPLARLLAVIGTFPSLRCRGNAEYDDEASAMSGIVVSVIYLVAIAIGTIGWFWLLIEGAAALIG